MQLVPVEDLIAKALEDEQVNVFDIVVSNSDGGARLRVGLEGARWRSSRLLSSRWDQVAAIVDEHAGLPLRHAQVYCDGRLVCEVALRTPMSADDALHAW